jgi:hypothetical protein
LIPAFGQTFAGLISIFKAKIIKYGKNAGSGSVMNLKL